MNKKDFATFIHILVPNPLQVCKCASASDMTCSGMTIKALLSSLPGERGVQMAHSLPLVRVLILEQVAVTVLVDDFPNLHAPPGRHAKDWSQNSPVPETPFVRPCNVLSCVALSLEQPPAAVPNGSPLSALQTETCETHCSTFTVLLVASEGFP